MSTGRPLAVLLLLGGCALPPDPGMPVPVPAPPAVTEAPVAPPVSIPAPAPQPDLERERRAAADSVADAAMLDLLARTAAPGADLALDPVRFDLDVATWGEHERVRYYLDFFQGPARDRMAIWLDRLPQYEAHVRSRLQAHGLPGDLVYLALIESGFSNTAVSRSGAVGMWQFMRPTGRMFGMRVDTWVDERRDFYKATESAARYLADLTKQFGSHFLAAAAYNGGPGRVSRGLDRIAGALDDEVLEQNGGLLNDAGFFQLSDSRHIHQETKDYVPKLLAATIIAKQPEKYGFSPSRDVEPFPTDSLVVTDATGFDVVARLAGTSLGRIRELNPQYKRNSTPPGRWSIIRLPTGSMPTVTAAYAELPARNRGGSPATVASTRAAGAVAGSHVVARGETLSGIAQRFGTTVARLRQWNGLSASGLIRQGQRLQVGPGESGRSTALASTGGANRTHLVRRGETLSAISRRYGVTVRALQDANDLASARDLKTGARLRIP